MKKRLIRPAAWALTALLAGNALAEEAPDHRHLSDHRAGHPAAHPLAHAADQSGGPTAGIAAVSGGHSIVAGGADGREAATLAFALLPARFRHTVDAVTPANEEADAQADPGIDPMDYRDRTPLITRLKELDGLRLLTFWETRAFAVFFGVSREGIAGLNITQKKNHRPDGNDDEAKPADPVTEPAFLATTAYRP